MIDSGEIEAQAIITVNNEQRQRNEQLRCVADSSKDNASPAGECQQSFQPEMELRGQFTENRLEQSVTSTDISRPTFRYNPLETLADCPIVPTVFDVDQGLEDWADIPAL